MDYIPKVEGRYFLEAFKFIDENKYNSEKNFQRTISNAIDSKSRANLIKCFRYIKKSINNGKEQEIKNLIDKLKTDNDFIINLNQSHNVEILTKKIVNPNNQSLNERKIGLKTNYNEISNDEDLSMNTPINQPPKKRKVITNSNFEAVENRDIVLNDTIEFPDELINSFESSCYDKVISIRGNSKCGKTTFIYYCAKKYNYEIIKYVGEPKNISNKNIQKYISESPESSRFLFWFPSCDKGANIDILHFEHYPHVFVFELDPIKQLNFQSMSIYFPRTQKKDRLKYIKHFNNSYFNDEVIDKILNWSKGFEIGNIESLFKYLLTLNADSITDSCIIEEIKDISSMVCSQSMYSSSTVSIESIGGHDEVKQILSNHINDLECENKKKIDGILLYGPPGTGKTMLAKAISTKLEVPFINVSATSILEKYQGESEKKVSLWFEKAKQCQPCILFIDEIDCLFKKRSDDNQGSINNIITEFLKCMDGLDEDMKKVLVIGTTNYKESIDEALLRTNRLGTHLYIGIPSNEKERYDVLMAVFKNNNFNSDTERINIIQTISKDEFTANFNQAELGSLNRGNEEEIITFEILYERIKVIQKKYQKNEIEQSNCKEIIYRGDINTKNLISFPENIINDKFAKYNFSKNINMYSMDIYGDQEVVIDLVKFLAQKADNNVIFLKESYNKDDINNLFQFLANFVNHHGETIVSTSSDILYKKLVELNKELKERLFAIMLKKDKPDSELSKLKKYMITELIKNCSDYNEDEEYEDVIKDGLSKDIEKLDRIYKIFGSTVYNIEMLREVLNL